MIGCIVISTIVHTILHIYGIAEIVCGKELRMIDFNI